MEPQKIYLTDEELAELRNKFAELNDDRNKDEQLEQNQLDYFYANRGWQNIIIPEEIITKIVDLGYSGPSEIQAKVIPFGLSRKSVGILGQSRSGTGKTLGFMIPAILRVDLAKPLTKSKTSYFPQVVILVPTNELCGQITKVGEHVAEAFPELKVSTGREAAHIIVMTPNRLLQFMSKKQIDLSMVNLMVLDEADTQLLGDSGSQINQCISSLPTKTGLFFFSSTFNQEVIEDIHLFFKKLRVEAVLRILLPTNALMLDMLFQFSRKCEENKKIDYTCDLIKSLEGDMQVIIFVDNKKSAEKILRELDEQGLSVGSVTRKDQLPSERTAKLNQFREGKFKILIANNLLTRGYDERTIGLVINFDLPKDLSGESAVSQRKVDLVTYLHRVGRTARYGECGLAVSLYCTSDEKEMLEDIEKHYGVKIKELSEETSEIKEFDLINDSLEKGEQLRKQQREGL